MLPNLAIVFGFLAWRKITEDNFVCDSDTKDLDLASSNSSAVHTSSVQIRLGYVVFTSAKTLGTYQSHETLNRYVSANPTEFTRERFDN